VLNVIPEPFFTINLPIPPNNKTPSLYECFDLYVEEERLENDNAWFNEETNKKEDVKKEIKFWSLPTIMAIDIKRFNNNNRKNQILVTFPVDNLDLSKYVIGYKMIVIFMIYMQYAIIQEVLWEDIIHLM
jgi:ubiquitin C-terminal hydrolase